MTRVAALGMYEHPAQHASNDALWAALATRLRAAGVADVPDGLDRGRPVQDVWRDPDLLFAQACGYPLASDATLDLQVIALPVYDAPGCVGDTHCSLIVTRADDPDALAAYHGRRAAINDAQSNTGMNLFRATIADVADMVPFFALVVTTGGHRASVAAIASGAADIAAIDAVTYAALDRFEPGLTRGLKIVARTPSSPTLPFVTAATTDAATLAVLRAALAAVVADPILAGARAALSLSGLSLALHNRFARLLALEAMAARSGYADLR